MMIINRFIIFIVCVFIASCTGKSDDNRTKDIQNKELTQSNHAPQPVHEHEDFHRFLKNFNTDRIFQMQRIIFPITVMTPDADRIALAPTEEKIEKMDWELLDLTYDSTFTTRDYDKYTQTINFRKDTAHVSLRGVDNGIFADYYFKLIDGEWYLVTLVE